MTDEERKAKIEEMRDRLADVPASVQLARLERALTHCFTCDACVGWGAEVCEHCGEELMEYGKIPAGMFASTDDLRRVAAGLLADGLDVSKLSELGKAELRTAIDIVLRLANPR